MSDPGPQVIGDLLAAERLSCLARITALEREFGGIIEAGSAGTDDEHDPEGATVAYERQHVAALLGRARRHLAEIDAALLRLREGSYGVCESCGQPVSAARLGARPTTTTCFACAT
jgi:DnaK suppressor protein